MPYMKNGRVRNSESANLLWVLRGLSLPPLVVSGRWGGLCVSHTGRLKAACTVIGAGAIGALLVLRYSPNCALSYKFSSALSTEPAISSKEGTTIHGEEELTVPGLLNAGNNCFLNVILQALASSKMVVRFMTACVEVTSKAELKAILTCNKDAVSMPLAVSVSSLMKELSQLGEANRTASPRRVMLALRSYAKHFDLASQQDAAEALVHLASALQEERDNYIRWLKPTFQTFATASLALDQGFPHTGEEGFKHKRGGDELLKSWRGQLHWPLEGTLASSLTCQRCAYQYTTQIQFFNDISLSPLQDRAGNIIQGCTLENCLDQFTGPEWIDNVQCSNCSHEAAVFSIYSIFRDSRSRTSKGPQSDEYTTMLQNKLKIIEECGCDDNCGCEGLTRQQGGIWRDVHANASKQLKIGRSPEVLCFQLQRAVMSEVGALKKLTGHVAFPMVLDLFPFTIAADSSSQMRNNSAEGTYGGSLPPNTMQQVTRSSDDQDSPVANLPLGHEMGLASNGEADLCDQKSSDTAEILCLPQQECPDICLADLIESPKNHDSFNVDACNSTTIEKVLEQVKATGKSCASKQNSKHEEVPFEDFSYISPLLSTSSGNSLTHSPLASSICSPYIPRVFPRHLQPWSIIPPHDGQQFSATGGGRLGNMSSINIAAKSTNRSIARSAKYSRRLLYDLVSVVVHQGGPQSGHYIVYRKMIRPHYNENMVLKDVPLPCPNANEQRPQQKVETCQSSVCIGDQGVAMQPGLDVIKDQAVAGHQLEPKSLSNHRCAGGATLHAQCWDSEDQKLFENRLQGDSKAMAAESFVQDSGKNNCREAKHGSTKVGTADKLVASWFKVSDTHVERVPEQEVFSAHASLLFYEQL